MLNIKHLIMIKMNNITPSWLLLLLWCGRLAVLSKEELSRNCKSFTIKQTEKWKIHGKWKFCQSWPAPVWKHDACEAGMVQIGLSKEARTNGIAKEQIIQNRVKTFRSKGRTVK